MVSVYRIHESVYFDNNNDNTDDNNTVSLISAYKVMMNYSYTVITLLSCCHSKKIAVKLSMIAFEIQNKQVILKWEQVFELLWTPALRSHFKFLLKSSEI